MSTKNNPANRGKSASAKHYNGKVIKPVKYIGSAVGGGTYIAAQYENGEMIVDNNGAPVAWDTI